MTYMKKKKEKKTPPQQKGLPISQLSHQEQVRLFFHANVYLFYFYTFGGTLVGLYILPKEDYWMVALLCGFTFFLIFIFHSLLGKVAPTTDLNQPQGTKINKKNLFYSLLMIAVTSVGLYLFPSRDDFIFVSGFVGTLFMVIIGYEWGKSVKDYE